MSNMDSAKCSNFFQVVFLILFINLCASAPVNLTENVYTQFVAELNRDNCSIPSEVHLPFDTTKANDFDYLSPYLQLCQKTESAKRNKEAVVLCKEIFDNIRTISCPPHLSLPDISEDLSANVCQDIVVLKDSVPESDQSLLKRLTDHFLCEMMCDSEFEKACQVLLWSFKVQKRIASVASAQEPEQPVVPEDLKQEDSLKQGNAVDQKVVPEIDANPENEDSLKQGNAVDQKVVPEMDANPKNEKQNVEEADNDGNKVAEQSGIAEVPEPRNLKDPVQNLILGEKEVPNVNGAVVGNQTVPNAASQNSTVAPSSTKLASTLLQTSPGVQTSKAVTSEGDIATDGQSANKQFQGKNEEGDAENELPQDPDGNVAVEEAGNGDVNAIPDETDQDEKGVDVHAQDNTNTITAGNKITDGTTAKEDESAHNDVPADELRNEKAPNEASSGLFKVQGNATSDDKSGKKTDSLTTTSLTLKGTTQLQTETQETTQHKTDVTGDETKADPLQTDSVSGKVEAQNRTQANHKVVTDVEPADQKTPKVAQQTEKPDNAGPSDERLSSTAGIPESLPETSTKTAAVLEKMEGGNDLHQPADEEAEHYGDTENTEDDEYSKAEPDYGVGLYEVSKNKESIPDVTSAKETITGQGEKPFPPRSPFGQDIQMISSFPEQEDSHFFFYFLSIVLILMAGYLIFHNKQKIIALIVEGRHERNRRSHRIGYKKLETK